MKKYPNYITKGWQYWSWLLVDFFLTCYFMVKMLGGANEAIIGVIVFALTNAWHIVMRSRWKKQRKAIQSSERKMLFAPTAQGGDL